MNSDSIQRINEVITKAQSGAIVLPNNPSQDAIAAATALYLSLTKMGKNVSIACSQIVESDLTASDKIQSQMVTSGDNLVVSFPYTDGTIDKVDYNIQGNYFNLIIAPRAGYSKLDPSQVKYSYSGGNLDFIITIDSPTLQSLGTLYTENQTQFQGKEIINIDRHLTNSFFGTINYINKTSSSISELVLKVLQSLRINIDKDVATNIYAGIAVATNNFTSYSVNADTFEVIANLLRLGAIKKTVRKPISQQPIISFIPPPQPSREVQKSKPIETIERSSGPEEVNTGQDLLKPKIFRGSSLV